MGCDRVPTQRCSLAYCYIAELILLSGCVTTSTTPEMAWVRTDGRKIADDPALLQQGKSDVAACDANLDNGSPTASARGCMAQKGYVMTTPGGLLSRALRGRAATDSTAQVHKSVSLLGLFCCSSRTPK